jgi:hypothetical protein
VGYFLLLHCVSVISGVEFLQGEIPENLPGFENLEGFFLYKHFARLAV